MTSIIFGLLIGFALLIWSADRFVIGAVGLAKNFNISPLVIGVIIIGFGCWHISGTEYMNSLIVNNEIQLAKVLPVVFGAACILGLIIYMYFGRSD